MTRAAEAKFGKIPKGELPSWAYLGTKLEEVEENDLMRSRSNKLRQRRTEKPILTAGINSAGLVMVKKA